MEATLILVGIALECMLINYIAGLKCRKRMALLESKNAALETKIAELERNQFIELQKQRA